MAFSLDHRVTTMNTATSTRSAEQFNQPSGNEKGANFDFDRWAVEVRKQMMASLQRRTVR
jgi:hypothetical protein